MTRLQGWIVVALLAFFCLHIAAADVVGLYLYSQIGDDTSVTQITDDVTPTITDRGWGPECDPEGDVCP